jgi:peptidoglycan/LPS O-acetylase OafA/YrhL
MEQSKGKYRPDIDGLRAIAITSVVFNHAGFPGFSGGFVGVDIFFVISGFLITSLLFNEAVASGRVNLSAFFARRVRRLMPASLVVVATTLVLGGALLPFASKDMAELARSAIAVAFFFSNIFFFNSSGGYFDAPSFALPLLHTWSLSVEEQYYLIWPLLMLLLFRFKSLTGSEAKARMWVIAVLGFMFVVSLALCVATTADHQKFAFYLLPSRIWEFAIGGILGLANERFYLRLQRFGELLAVIGLALIGYAIVELNHKTVFPGTAAILPVLGSAMLIAGMTAYPGGVVRRIMSLRPFVAIGLLSYSWYLWHWPLLSIYRIQNLGVLDITANVIIVTLALVMAWMTYIWIERPVRMHRPWVFNAVRSTLLAGVGISLSMALMAGGLMLWRSHQKNSDLYVWLKSGREDVQMGCSISPDEPLKKLPGSECFFGPKDAPTKIVLWGDSHAQDKTGMLLEALPDTKIYQLTSPGCIPVIGYEDKGMPNTTKICKELNKRALNNILERSKQGLAGVVISARWENYLWHESISAFDQRLNIEPATPEKKALMRAAMQKDLDAELDVLERAGLRVAVIAPVPSLVYDPQQCIGLNRGEFCHAPRALNDTLLVDATEALAEVVARHPNAKLLRVMDYFCDKDFCYAYRDGKLVYYDDDHITGAASRGLGRYLASDLGWLLEKTPTGTR